MKLGLCLGRYLTKTFMKWLLIISGVFIVIFCLFDGIELLRKTSGDHTIPITLILRMMIYRLPWFFHDILPFIVFFASIITFWKLNRSNELLIIRSVGISIWRFLAPLMLVVLSYGVFDLMVINPFSTKLMEKYNFLESRYIYKSQTPFSISSSGLWLREAHHNKQVIINAKSYHPNRNEFGDINLYLFDQNDGFLERIYGPKAILSDEELIIPSGWRMKKQGYPVRFSSYRIPTTFDKTKIKDSFSDPDTLSFYTLRNYASLMRDSGLSSTPYEMQWHTLISKCFWLSVMVMLAATFSLGHMRSQKGSFLILSGIGLTFILYFLKDITFALGSAGNLPPILAAWVPVVVTALLAMTKLLYAEEG